MPRTLLTYTVNDMSGAARSLRQQLAKLERPPSHVEMLNMLARAAGFRNFQHFRAQSDYSTAYALLPEATASAPIDISAVERAAGFFDSDGRLIKWPSKDSRARLCLWVIWSRLPSAQSMDERELNEILKAQNTFDDHALLRRALVDYGLVKRTASGSSYLRIEQLPPAELRHLLPLIGGHKKAIRIAK